MKKHTLNILKKALAASVAVCFLLIGASCGESKRSVLWYEKDLYGVRCTVDTHKGEYGAFVMKLIYGEEDHAIVESPAELAGTDFVRGDGMNFVEFGGQKVDMSDRGLGDINIIFDAFKIKEEDIKSLIKNDDGKTEIGVVSTGGVYTLILGDDGLPEEIHFEGLSNVIITDIELLEKSTDTGRLGHIELIDVESESGTESGEVSETDGE